MIYTNIFYTTHKWSIQYKPKTDNNNQEQIQNEGVACDENDQDIDIVSAQNQTAAAAIATNARSYRVTTNNHSSFDRFIFSSLSWCDMSNFKKFVDNYDPNAHKSILAKYSIQLINEMYKYHNHMLKHPQAQELLDEIIVDCFNKYVLNDLEPGIVRQFYRLLFRKSASATADIFNNLSTPSDRQQFESKLKDALIRNLPSYQARQGIQHAYIHPYH